MTEFTKIHGNGNDFIIIDETSEKIVPDNEKANFAVEYCDRRFGVGGDGVIFISRPENADLKMRLFQPDASEAEMCGNGIRCLVKYAYDNQYIPIGESTVETMVGTLKVSTREGEGKFWVNVNMGAPFEKRKDLPAEGEPESEFMDVEMHGYEVSVVNTGVPHAIVFVKELDKIDILDIAPRIRYDKIFPNGVNVNFVSIVSDSVIKVRTYERGVEDETLSCGTGSVAAAYLSFKKGYTDNEVEVHTQGGILNIQVDTDTTFMEGPAETVYSGVILK